MSRLCLQRGFDLYLLNRGTREVDISKTKTIRGDINQADKLKSELNKHTWDVVVDWIAFTVGDIERDISLFRQKTRQFVFISSASAYQKPPAHHVITESTPLANPFWQYSRDKIACEERLIRAYREEGFPATVVRPSHTYDTVIPVPLGGWTEYTVVDRMKRGKPIIVHGDGTSLWVLTHAEDFAKGFVGLLGRQQTIGHAFHITSDEILTWNQIYEIVARAAGCEPNLVHIASERIVECEPSLTGNLLGDKAYSAMFDNSKIKSFVPDFAATIPFEEGIRRTLGWFEAESSRKIIRPETDQLIERILEQCTRYERAARTE